MDLLSSIASAKQDGLKIAPPKSGPADHCVFYCSGMNKKKRTSLLNAKWSAGPLPEIEDIPVQEFRHAKQTIWFLTSDFYEVDVDTPAHNEKLMKSEFGRARDLCGSWLRQKKIKGIVEVQFLQVKDEEVLGAIVGFGLASYQFLDICRQQKPQVSWRWLQNKKPVEQNILTSARAFYTSMNLSRHLTNMPAEIANPENLSRELAKLFRVDKRIAVDVFSEAALRKENCHLLLGVGQGSRTGARLLRLRYKGDLKNKKYFAFVGKGVTFDTGGLDLKNSAGMRMMKKDMAGAATMAGLCLFVSQIRAKHNCEFYLPLAENSVSDRATRPGDIHRSRNGLWVEIDNTDAEGRLVMADAFDLALNNKTKQKPEALFDVATLTGAMRVAVGLDIAGYFSNNDGVAKKIDQAAIRAGEPIWRMPLFSKYKKMLSSSFADCKNSSDSGFGGAITAALFLQKFVGDTPWVHFDVNSWSTSGDGALSEGANAQCFQTLAHFLMK